MAVDGKLIRRRLIQHPNASETALLVAVPPKNPGNWPLRRCAKKLVRREEDSVPLPAGGIEFDTRRPLPGLRGKTPVCTRRATVVAGVARQR